MTKIYCSKCGISMGEAVEVAPMQTSAVDAEEISVDATCSSCEALSTQPTQTDIAAPDNGRI